MPLSKGTSDKTRSGNIAEMIKAGYSKAQAAAAAYHEQRKAIAEKRKRSVKK